MPGGAGRTAVSSICCRRRFSAANAASCGPATRQSRPTRDIERRAKASSQPVLDLAVLSRRLEGAYSPLLTWRAPAGTPPRAPAPALAVPCRTAAGDHHHTDDCKHGFTFVFIVRLRGQLLFRILAHLAMDSLRLFNGHPGGRSTLARPTHRQACRARATHRSRSFSLSPPAPQTSSPGAATSRANGGGGIAAVGSEGGAATRWSCCCRAATFS